MKDISTTTKVVIGAGLLLVINLFTPWYRQGGFFSTGFGADAYDAGFLAWGGSWFGIAAAAIVAVRKMGKPSERVWPFPPELFALLLALTSFVLILVRLITENDQMWLGPFVGLIASAVLTFSLLGAAGITITTTPQAAAPPPPPAE